MQKSSHSVHILAQLQKISLSEQILADYINRARPCQDQTDSGLGPLDETFWQSGFEVIEGFLEELKSLVQR